MSRLGSSKKRENDVLSLQYVMSTVKVKTPSDDQFTSDGTNFVRHRFSVQESILLHAQMRRDQQPCITRLPA